MGEKAASEAARAAALRYSSVAWASLSEQPHTCIVSGDRFRAPHAGEWIKRVKAAMNAAASTERSNRMMWNSRGC